MTPAALFSLHLQSADEAMDQVEYFMDCSCPRLARRWAQTARHNLDHAEQLLRARTPAKPRRRRAARGGAA